MVGAWYFVLIMKKVTNVTFFHTWKIKAEMVLLLCTILVTELGSICKLGEEIEFHFNFISSGQIDNTHENLTKELAIIQ